MDRGAWQATVYGVANNPTRLSDWHTFTFHGFKSTVTCQGWIATTGVLTETVSSRLVCIFSASLSASLGSYNRVLANGGEMSKATAGPDSFFFFNIILFFKLYNVVLVLPNIEMNPPQVYRCSPFWTLLPPPSPYPPSGLSQCTSP